MAVRPQTHLPTFRAIPDPATTTEDLSKPTEKALASAVSWGVVKHWWPSPYEPETIAFGGPTCLDIAHNVFHADSVGVLEYLYRAGPADRGLLDAKERG